MVIFPNAKINIGLNILRKRPDGYHDLETLFYPIGLRDALEYVPNGTGNVRFSSSGLPLGIGPEENIVYKAYRLLQERYTLPGLDIHLHKAIPAGAGLGGGSSDAAFFLKALNEHFELGVPEPELRLYASGIGADCTFFLDNVPSIALGIGDILNRAAVNLAGYHLVLVKPPFGIDTREAYAGVHPSPYPYDFKTVLEGSMEGWRDAIRNDFEQSLFPRHPELAAIKEKLYGLGAGYSSMSGSGSAVYGLFREDPGLSADEFPPGYFIWQEKLE